MWYLAISIWSISSGADFSVVTQKTFSTLEECQNYGEYYLNNDNLSYSEMCVHEDDIEYLGFDDLTGELSGNVFYLK